MIHPTAIISPKAKVDGTVNVGPYAVIDADVTVGPRCEIGPHVYLTGVTEIGAHNHFHSGCVIGDAPQDLKYKGQPTRVRIGEHNVFREHATVNRSASPEGETVVGSNNFIMICGHIAHDCMVGNNIVLANGALLSGHVQVEDRAFISGTCLVHQFVRIGRLALMQGGAAISKDLPPYTVARGYNGICGLNIIGLRRSGMTPAERLELKKVYRLLFRSGEKLKAAAAAGQKEFKTPAAMELLNFVAASKRGVCADHGTSAEDEEVDEGG